RDPSLSRAFVLVIASADRDMTSRSRGALRPRLAGNFQPPKIQRAQGRPGAGWHPRSRVQWVNKSAHEHTGISRGIPPSLRNGFTAYRALSLETNFPLASIAGELTTFRSPVGPGKSPPA